MKKTILIFTAIILGIFLLLKLSAFSIASNNLKLEIGIGAIAVVFFFIGIWMKHSSSEKQEYTTSIDTQKLRDLEITSREYEVLMAISEGLSNREIGAKLHLSESTVKTHVSNLLLKLNAKRRTQALQVAKSMKII
jgi:DNA-binding NarL/FixJ family response regulator